MKMRRKHAESSNVVLPTPGKKFHNIDTGCAESANDIADSGTKNDRFKKLHKKLELWQIFGAVTFHRKLFGRKIHNKRLIDEFTLDQMTKCWPNLVSAKYIHPNLYQPSVGQKYRLNVCRSNVFRSKDVEPNR
jgi:hypothetical protein